MEFLTRKERLLFHKIEENDEECEQHNNDDVEGNVGVEDLLVFALEVHLFQTVRNFNPYHQRREKERRKGRTRRREEERGYVWEQKGREREGGGSTIDRER